MILKRGIPLRLFKVKNGRHASGRQYFAWEVRWLNHAGHRQRRKFSQKREAIEEAGRIYEQLQQRNIRRLNPVDSARWETSLKNLAPTGVATDTATQVFAELHAIVKGDLELLKQAAIEAAERRLRQCPTVDAAAEEFLGWQKKKGVSVCHLKDLKTRLKAFRSAFQCRVDTVTLPMVDSWLGKLEGTNRSRNNYLGAVSNFLNWCRQVRTYTNLHFTLSKAIVAPSENEIWRPAEMKVLLERASIYRPALVPYVAIGAFAKLRTAELCRLDWSQIRFDEGVIVVRRKQAKTQKSRKIVMPANLVAWLRPHAKLSGPVCPYVKIHRPLAELARDCGLKWKRNGLRNSASTYHTLLTNDLNLVSREAGNSPHILEAEYLEMVGATAAQAKEWFEIFPPAGEAKVLTLPLFG